MNDLKVTGAFNNDSVDSEKYRKGMVSALGSSERICKINAMFHAAPYTICLHRARAYTAVFAETEGEPTVLRHAKAFKKVLEDLPIVIPEGELIVGMTCCRLRSVPVIPETHGGWLLDDIENLPTREQDTFEVTDEQMVEVKKILNFWKDKNLFTLWLNKCPEEVSTKVIGTGWADCGSAVFMQGYHFTPPWAEILNSGLQLFEERVQERLTNLDLSNPEDMGKEHFFKALLIIIDAIRGYSNRCSSKASSLAAAEGNEKRRQELKEISEACKRVPYYPARSFREAIQAFWFIQMLMYLEGTGAAYTPGRFDQYMYPFFKADLERGILTVEEAQELIEDLFIKLSNNLWLNDSQTAIAAPGRSQYQVFSLGGVDSLGRDASNELSYLCIDAMKAVRTTSSDIVLLCHPRETPYELKMKAAQVVGLGLGFPKFINTETLKTQLMALGYSREEAIQGWIDGCSESYGAGSKQYGHRSSSFMNLPLALEVTLFNGYKQTPGQPGSGQQLGLITGDPISFRTFEQLMDAFKKQVAEQVRQGHIGGSYAQLVQKEHFPFLLQSLLTNDCIGRGLTVSAGGALVNVGPGFPFGGGIATAADSLVAIKKLVYEEQKISMAELIRALDANFEGYERVQQMLINDAPKFGNDDDSVDEIAREIFQFANNEIRRYVGPLGNRNVPNTAVSTGHVMLGGKVWATPDGRKAGTPLSDNIGPSNQRDKEGPVAVINSASKLGLETQFGSIHNIYFDNIESDNKKHKMLDLIDTYFGQGGHHLQINCIGKETLLDAQKYPEKYPTLLVRVAGYVAYFVDLSKRVQDDIIGRMAHRL